jgi:hypothetical protein
MSYKLNPFNPTTPYENQVTTELNDANENFKILGQAFYKSDPSSNPILRASYVGTSAPSNPVAGTTWLDTSINPSVLKVYDGNNWQRTSSISSDSVLDLSSGYIKSNAYTFRRVDLTNASSDYNLQVGEEAIYYLNNTNSINLHIATQSGTFYELTIFLSNPVGTSGGNSTGYNYGYASLNPNNTTYSRYFNYVEVYMRFRGNNNSNNNPEGWLDTLNSFIVGRQIASTKAFISNFTTNKHLNSFESVTGNQFSPVVQITSCYWNDTSTAWTSLGTILFEYSSSGYILVRRLI